MGGYVSSAYVIFVLTHNNHLITTRYFVEDVSKSEQVKESQLASYSKTIVFKYLVGELDTTWLYTNTVGAFNNLILGTIECKTHTPAFSNVQLVWSKVYRYLLAPKMNLFNVFNTRSEVSSICRQNSRISEPQVGLTSYSFSPPNEEKINSDKRF